MEAAHTSWRSLGELFVERGLISEADLERALDEQVATKRRLADILVEGGLVTGHDITSALMEQLNGFDSLPTTEKPEDLEPVDPVETEPEPKPQLMLLQGDSAGEDAVVTSPVDELALPLRAEVAD